MLRFLKRLAVIWLCLLLGLAGASLFFEALSMLANLITETWGRLGGQVAFGLAFTGIVSVLTAVSVGEANELGPK